MIDSFLETARKYIGWVLGVGTAALGILTALVAWLSQLKDIT